jgi:hypothetical protein
VPGDRANDREAVILTGVWGVQKRGKKVHYYNNGRTPLCGIGGYPAWVKEEWDPDHELTCPSCKHMLEMMRLGFKPIKVSELLK